LSELQHGVARRQKLLHEHLHVPLWQVWLAGHTVPHAPQLLLSVWVLTHAEPQWVLPLVHEHAPLLQVRGLEHTVVHEPQWLLSVCSLTHAPLHRL
jgi:hypothetical protein